jgi:hypothetical protein
VVATPVAVHCDRPVQDTPLRNAPLKPGKAAAAAMPACGVIARAPVALARAQGMSQRVAGLGAVAAAAAVAVRAVGDAAVAAAGPAVIIAPARTVATMAAPDAGAAARRDLRRRPVRHLVPPPAGPGVPLPLAAPVRATRVPAMPSSVG